MTQRFDGRIPLRFAPAAKAGEGAALLIEGDGAAQGGLAVARFTLPPGLDCHPVGCACCAPRGPVAEALSWLFLARARGEVGFFHEVVAVVASPSGEEAVRAALADDPLVSGRYRLGS